MRSKRYLRYVASLSCSHCGTTPVQCHHLIGIGDGKMGGKASDLTAVPLCQPCHSAVHSEPSSWPQAKWMINTQLQAIADGELILP